MTKRIFYLCTLLCLPIQEFHQKANHRDISQDIRLFFKPGLGCLLFLVENICTYQGLAYKTPHPCSWPLHGDFFFFYTVLVRIILLRLFNFIHHWHHIRARRIWLAYMVGPCAVFADMRSFYFLVIRPWSCITSPKETSFSNHHETQLITFFSNFLPILRPEQQRYRSDAGRSGNLAPLSDRYGQMENIRTLP